MRGFIQCEQFDHAKITISGFEWKLIHYNVAYRILANKFVWIVVHVFDIVLHVYPNICGTGCNILFHCIVRIFCCNYSLQYEKQGTVREYVCCTKVRGYVKYYYSKGVWF